MSWPEIAFAVFLALQIPVAGFFYVTTLFPSLLDRFLAYWRRPAEPVQVRLEPEWEVYCPWRGLKCVYRDERGERYPGSGFYGRCWNCGTTYDPGCDR